MRNRTIHKADVVGKVYEVNMENYRQIVDDTIKLYCEDLGLKEDKIPPRQWNDVLDTIRDATIRATDGTLLRLDTDPTRQYDSIKLYKAYEIYKRICNRHNKTINIAGFEYMTGVDRSVLYNWDTETSLSMTEVDKLREKGVEVSTAHVNIREKIMKDNEESLERLLESGACNPVAALGMLNRHHQWNMPGVRNDEGHKKALTAADLPKLGDGEN